jgi:ATP-binding cassette, subfamily B, bacterial MsbA
LFLAVLLVAWQLEIGLSSLFAFLVLLYRMQPRLKDLDHARVTLATYGGAIRQIDEQLAPEAPPRPASGTRPFAGLDREIVLDRVTFGYGRGGPPAVSEVALRIARGEVVALIGGSGAGKSTLVNLLCRLYDPQAGEIRVDGVPLAELDLAAWRARIGFAGQDAELMSDTVAENIAYGCPGADMGAIERAARQAHADGFIAALPEGYATRVGPRGLALSSGQRQRIALARALLRAPDLLILDEATNALDGLSEQAIGETIEELRGRPLRRRLPAYPLRPHPPNELSAAVAVRERRFRGGTAAKVKWRLSRKLRTMTTPVTTAWTSGYHQPSPVRISRNRTTLSASIDSVTPR